MGVKITDLPDAPYRAVAKNAEARGRAILGDIHMNGEATVLIGLCDIIREMQEKLECHDCNHVFEIKRHVREIIPDPGCHRLVIKCGTGLNMVYSGQMNREYARCPKCGAVEGQFSAEARDQSADSH